MNTRSAAVAMIVGITVASSGVNADESAAPKALQTVTPKLAPFSINGSPISPPQAALTNGPLPKVPQILRYIKYSYIECRADWNERCAGDEIVEAPPGYQVCNFVYTITSESGGNSTAKRFEPGNWYTDDPQRPPRFRAFKIHIEAWGSGIIYDQSRGWIRLENVGVTLINAEYDNNGRYLAGCFMPEH